MIADALTAAPIIRMDRETAIQWAKLVCDGVMDGRVSLTFADEAVLMLEKDGFFDVASGVRCAVQTRSIHMRLRGFSTTCRVPR